MSDENLYAAPEADVEVSNEFGEELAGRWARLFGSILDGLILGVVFWGLFFIAGMIFDFGFSAETMLFGSMWTQSIVFFLAFVGLYVVINGSLLASEGQTVGKKLVGTRIVSATDNSRLPLSRLIGMRYVPYMAVSLIPIIGGILSLINILFIFRSDKRCVHDLIAGTKVVKA